MSSEVQGQIVGNIQKALNCLQHRDFAASFALLRNAEELAAPGYVPRMMKINTFFAFAKHFQLIGHRHRALKYLEKILVLTQDKIVLAKSHLNIAFLISLQGQHQKSLFHNIKALNLLQSSQEFEGIVSAYHGIGTEYQILCQPQKSAQAFKEGLLISKSHLGINHKLTRILRNCYLEMNKTNAFALYSQPKVQKYDNLELTRIVNEIERPAPKFFTPLPKYLHSKHSSPVPKTGHNFSRSVQCDTGDLEKGIKVRKVYESPIPRTSHRESAARTAWNKSKVNKSSDFEDFPVPNKTKIVFAGKNVFTLSRSNLLDRAATRIQSAYRRWILRRSFLLQRSSALLLQTHWRRFQSQRLYRSLTSAALTIQRVFKGFRTRKLYKFLLTPSSLPSPKPNSS